MNGQKLLNLNKLASKCLIGNYSTKTINSLNIFDRKVKKIQRNRIASDPSNTDYDYLKSEVGYRVVDRIFDIKRSFNTILDLGCQKGYVSRHLNKVNISFIQNCSNFYKIVLKKDSAKKIFMLEMSDELLVNHFEYFKINLIKSEFFNIINKMYSLMITFFKSLK